MKMILPFDLEEVVLFDDKGKKIKNIKSISNYKKGIVVITDSGCYTNEKSLLKSIKLIRP